MATYAQERAEKDAARARKARRYIYEPVGLDRWDARTSLKRGETVVKIQPHGTPRNGTLGHTYVGDPETGAFIGLVLTGSLRAA